MKHSIKHIFQLMAMAICCFAVASCQDDTFSGFGIDETGDMEVTFTVDMPPLSTTNMTSRGTAGNAIKDFDKSTLYIYIYNEDGTQLICDRLGYSDLEDFKYTADGNTKSPAYPYGNGDSIATSQGEKSTPRATFKFKNNPFERGKKYQIFVTANVEVPASAYNTADNLKAYQVIWNNDPTKTASNNQMFGMFALSDESVDGEIISFIGASTFQLHAWLVRCASKVTISFDTTELNDNTWIYLHNVRIHNVPKQCHLGSRNTATEEEGNGVEDDGDMIMYAPEGSDYANAANEFSSWPTLTRGTKYYPMSESDSQDHPENHAVHSETAEALYFYENLQGTGKDKSQIDSDKKDTPDGEVSWPNGIDPNDDKYRDEKRLGTYIEVEAYYRSTTKGNEGMGTIKYRFMLGMDAFKDYNAYRNHHFKLIMAFKGNANDVDWHIEYVSNDDNPIYVPNPFYISYLYGESVDIPITVNGRLAEGSKITAEIVENNWKPMDAPGTVYWNGPVKSGANENFDGPWHGFLSLRPTNAIANRAGSLEVPNSDAIGREHTLDNISTGWAQGRCGAYLMSYWYGGSENMPPLDGVTLGDLYSSAQIDGNEQMHVPPQGYRVYETTKRDGKTTDNLKDNVDEYEISQVENNGKIRTHLYLPLYTRALFMVKGLGYSGANPYFFYQRKAVVKITCTVETESGPKKYSKLCDVIQVRRIINPCGIYRKAGNNESFTVTLSFRTAEKATTFMPFASEGKWSAEIENGDESFITLNGQQKVFGRTGEFIKFQVHFIPTANLNKNRYAVILVKYHDYTCKHRIMVRQGYSPDYVVGENLLTGEKPVAWHCFNLRGGEREAESPLEAGSLFRFGNLNQGIDASNNTSDQVNVAPPSQFDIVDKTGEISGKSSWGELDFEKKDLTNLNDDNLAFRQYIVLKDGLGRVTNSGKKTRLAKFNEWKNLREHSDITYTYGICYDDNSSGTSMTADNAFNYSVFNPDKRGSGMRGIFLYNNRIDDHDYGAHNLFLPVGASGHGRRNRGGTGDNYAVAGTLRYATRAIYMRQGLVEYAPVFWNIKDNIGALYWGYPESFSPSLPNVWSKDASEEISQFTTWDINMSTYDFNQFGKNGYTGTDSDAAFIRLVDEP